MTGASEGRGVGLIYLPSIEGRSHASTVKVSAQDLIGVEWLTRERTIECDAECHETHMREAIKNFKVAEKNWVGVAEETIQGLASKLIQDAQKAPQWALFGRSVRLWLQAFSTESWCFYELPQVCVMLTQPNLNGLS